MLNPPHFPSIYQCYLRIQRWQKIKIKTKCTDPLARMESISILSSRAVSLSNSDSSAFLGTIRGSSVRNFDKAPFNFSLNKAMLSYR